MPTDTTTCSRCDESPHPDTEVARTICQIRFLLLDTSIPDKLDATLRAAASDLEEWEVDGMIEADAQRREDGYRTHGGSARGTSR